MKQLTKDRIISAFFAFTALIEFLVSSDTEEHNSSTTAGLIAAGCISALISVYIFAVILSSKPDPKNPLLSRQERYEAGLANRQQQPT